MAALSKSGAALASVGSGVVLTALKLGVGLATGSLGILAEAAHSALDLGAAAITLLVVKVSALPPDENHPYGHERAEHLGALAETVLLIVTAGWVFWESYERIFVQVKLPEVGIWSFAVVLVSLCIDFTRSRALKRAAREFKSQALEADAAHFTNDMLGAAVVLLSLVVIKAAPRLPFLPSGLVARVDALAAVVVALIALYISWTLGARAIRALMDDVPSDLNQRLVRQIAAVDGVVPGTAQVRTRFVGERPHVEVRLGIPRGNSLQDADRLIASVEAAIQADLGEQADVLVQVKPARTTTEPYMTAVYAAAQSHGLQVHNVAVYQLAEGVRVDVDLELPPDLTLGEAHTASERLEAAIQEEMGRETTVAVHLEPRQDQVRPAVRYDPLRAEVSRTLGQIPGAEVVTRSEVLLSDEGPVVILHCGFPPQQSLTEVHTAMEELEHEIRQRMPEVAKVLVDPEPNGDEVIPFPKSTKGHA